MAPSPAMIELTGVCKAYGGKEVVRDVSLSAEAGWTVALLGHNGAGKTTLMKMMLGLTHPSAGHVRVAGRDPAGADAVGLRSRLGYLPENVAFHGAMTGREVMAFYARLKGQSQSDCALLLDRVGLGEAAARRISTYSKGMRQRLGLAQALLGRPRLLFLDEPTTGLDPPLRRWFYRLMDDMRSEGVTIVLSTHALAEIEAHTDRVAILKEGKLAAYGTLEALSAKAGLPVQIRMTVPHGRAADLADRLGGGVTLHRVNDETVDLTCPGADKMITLRRITALGDRVLDVDIRSPRLEEIYRHFAGEEGA